MPDAIAKALIQARSAGQLVNCATLPTTEDEAYLIQQSIVKQSTDTISGIKIGATNANTQNILGLNQPFYGPVFSSNVFTQDTPTPLATGYPVKVETEFVIGLKNALIGSPGKISMDQVLAAVDWVAPGFELIGSRIKNAPEKAGLCAIADGGGNHNVVVGNADGNWQTRDWQHQQATLNINGNQINTGHSGDSIAGSPMGMLHWLVNFERFAGQKLSTGQFVFCGTCTAPVLVHCADQLHADFGELGELRITCSS